MHTLSERQLPFPIAAIRFGYSSSAPAVTSISGIVADDSFFMKCSIIFTLYFPSEDYPFSRAHEPVLTPTPERTILTYGEEMISLCISS